MVLIPVSVTDARNHPVLGLDKSSFRVIEGQRSQEVKYLSFEDSPMAIGLIFDNSGSMKNKIARARAAVSELLKTANPEDEFFLVEFNDHPHLVQPLTGDAEDIRSRLTQTNPEGRTALLDAVAVGLGELKRSKKPRKALVIMSDGGDNRSRYTAREVRGMVMESDASIYALGIFEDNAARLTVDQLEAPELLKQLADVSGGTMFTVNNLNDLPAMAERIGVDLHNRYLLGYVPDNLQADGRYHRVRIEVTGDKGLQPLHVDSRGGYRAPVH